MKKLAQFVLMTITSAVTIFAFFILFFRTDLVIELISSKPVLLLLGLTIGSTVGFLVGVFVTYSHFSKLLENAETELKQTKRNLKSAQKVVNRLIPEVEQARKFNSDKSAEEAKNNCDKRAKQIFSAIGDLSENDTKPVVEEEVVTDDDEFDAQDDVADET